MDPLATYFHTEKTESMLFVGTGIAGVLVAVFWWLTSSAQVLIGAGWPLFFLGMIQLAVGGIIYFRTDGQVEELRKLQEESPEAFRITEMERMHRVSQNFIRIRWTEIALFITSGIMILIFFPLRGYGLGFGTALLFESTIMLILDFVAEERADHYRDYVKRVG